MTIDANGLWSIYQTLTNLSKQLEGVMAQASLKSSIDTTAAAAKTAFLTAFGS